MTTKELELLGKSGELLEAGKIEESLSLLEGAADRGLVHPDLSFNRGFAYLKRAESPAAAPGDLGQAIASFSEALKLRPSDPEATSGLERAQILLSQRTNLEHTTGSLDDSIFRPLMAQVPPLPPAIVAGLGAALLCGAWLGRLITKEKPRTLAIGLVGLTLWLAGALVYAGRLYALSSQSDAIVISARAELRDEAGRTLRGTDGLPQGTRVRVKETRGRLSRIESGRGDLWVDAADLRRLAETIE